jgi:hypothetical protein
MVSSPHEAMHRVFQQDPGVFARAVRALGIPFDDPVSATPLPTDLTENRPLERRVDTLLRMDAADGTSFVLAVEAQGKKDPDKPASWSYYLAHLYAKYRLPPLLVVVCRAGSPPTGLPVGWTSVRRSGPRSRCGPWSWGRTTSP